MQLKHFAITSATAIALGMSASASAAVINFDQSGAASPTGSISYDGEGGALTGSQISFDQISLNNATTPDGADNTLTCNSCTINFETGQNITEAENNTGTWNFAGGGNLTLNGTAVDSEGSTVADGDLFTGTFDGGANESTQFVAGNGDDNLSASLTGTDDFNENLASYFGLSTNSGFDFTNTVIALGSATFGDNGSFGSDQLQNADTTVQSSQDVPAPSQFGLFGLGLALVMGGLGFRRKQGGDMA
ncbi:PEP-CTERM sorting domain-containing protein [Salinisphaera sp. SPP-AMP-43]|uniref:PEP-CTERM sorting domain-containing protein n=1 Tax=Salinisphaera sp. SPP-AMP-43 TaxID=3121288 RepID=UPI003C6E01A0